MNLPQGSLGEGSINWRAASFAGAAYSLSVFAIAFVLGAIRVTQIVPRLGALTGVVLEAPFVLSVSWLVSRSCIRRLRVGRDAGSCLWMGAVAFACLMVLEVGLSVLAFGETLEHYFAKFHTTAGVVGLIMQVVFACIPWLQSRWHAGAWSR